MKTFVDNVCRQVVERYLRSLLEIFSTKFVAAMNDEELERLAAERPSNTKSRKDAQELLQQLRGSLRNISR